MKLKGDISLKLQAKFLYNGGYNMCPVSNEKNGFNFLEPNLLKAPSIPYRHLYSQRQSIQEFNALNLDDAVGIGIILGFNDIMAIDIDGCVDFNLIEFICNEIGLSSDYKWIVRTGSQVGYHIILRCKDKESSRSSFGRSNVDSFYPNPVNYIPNSSLYDSRLQLDDKDKAKFNNYNIEEVQKYFNKNFTLRNLFQKIEFGWKGFLVLPPSMHSSGNYYEFINGIPDSHPTYVSFKNLENLRDFIASKKRSFNTIKQEVADIIEENESNYEDNTDTEFIFFDIISNGVAQDFTELEKLPKLLQLSWLIVNSNLSLIRKEDYLIQIGNLERIHNINGLDAEIFNSFGYPVKFVLNKFLKDVEKCKGKIISHDYEFNSNIIMGELLRCGLNPRILSNKSHDCTMSGSITSQLKNNKTGINLFSLEDLYFALFQKELNVFKNAFSKALVCKICYEKMYGDENSDYIE